LHLPLVAQRIDVLSLERACLHKGNVLEKAIEGAYEVLGIFDRVEDKRDAMQSLLLPPPAQQAFARAALTYCFGEEYQPVMEAQILTPAAMKTVMTTLVSFQSLSGEPAERWPART